MYANLNTPELSPVSVRPNPIFSGGYRVDNPTTEQYQLEGWRCVSEEVAIPSGKELVRWTLEDVDGVQCRRVPVVTDIQPVVYVVSEQDVPLLQHYREIMRRRFGADAEQNKDLSYPQVAGSFIAISDPTVQDVSDKFDLQTIFDRLAPQYGGDMTNVPWGNVP